jgi:hypothetical protein
MQVAKTNLRRFPMSAGTLGRKKLVRTVDQQLGDLVSVGPAILRDFRQLGIRSVAQLARQNPRKMYDRLGRLAGHRQDPCVLDTFCAAVAQARNPRLPAEKCQWWWWSRKRKKLTVQS